MKSVTQILGSRWVELAELGSERKNCDVVIQ